MGKACRLGTLNPNPEILQTQALTFGEFLQPEDDVGFAKPNFVETLACRPPRISLVVEI